jgi:hypothetical protein
VPTSLTYPFDRKSPECALGTDYPFAQEIGVRYSLDGLAAYEAFGEEERDMIESGTALALFQCLRTLANRRTDAEQR